MSSGMLINFSHNEKLTGLILMSSNIPHREALFAQRVF
jgi:hypothetical protein